jgi:hypothetical protein
MNRIPTIAAAIALIALLLAAYLALSSRIARLEEAFGSSHAEAETGDPSADFVALGYDGTGALRLRMSTRLPARTASPVTHAAPPAISEPPAPDRAAPAMEPAEPAPESSSATGSSGTAELPTPVVEAPQPQERGWLSRMLASVVVGDEPTPEEIEAGIREALSAGTEAALVRLGRPGGYADDPQLAIALPQRLEAVRYVLRGVGLSTLMDDLRVRLNRAAELVAPDAREPFLRAIAELPFDDPVLIHGGDGAATSYLRSRMAGHLSHELRPLMARRLKEVGAYDLYRQALGMYAAVPFVPPIDGDIARYATSRSLDGIFYCLNVEEQELRSNPARHTTVALRAAFGHERD